MKITTHRNQKVYLLKVLHYINIDLAEYAIMYLLHDGKKISKRSIVNQAKELLFTSGNEGWSEALDPTIEDEYKGQAKELAIKYFPELQIS